MRRVCGAALAAVVLAGCVSPKLTRHYGMVDGTATGSGNLALSVFLANPRTDEELPLIAKLGDRGQAELIRSVAARMPQGSDAAALLTALGSVPAAAPADCAWADTTSLKKRVTMTVLGGLGRPADRVDRLELWFALPHGAGYEFASWDKFDSEYGSFDLGSAKYTQTRTFKLNDQNTDTRNRPGDAGSVVKLLGASYDATDNLEENMHYELRRLKVGGALQADRATLVQEGGPYINLIGTSSAVFTLKLTSTGDPQPVHELTFKQGSKTPPDEVGVTRCQVRYPASGMPLTVQVGGSALKRLVLDHHDTISEGDDAVTFERQAFDPVMLQIASRQDMKAEFFGLVLCRPRDALQDCLELAIENPDSGKVEDTLMVRTPDNAAKLRDWLVANIRSGAVPGTIGTRRIGLANARTHPERESGKALTPDILRSLRIARLGGNAESGASPPATP